MPRTTSKLTDDDIQNALLSIEHHAKDGLEGLKRRKIDLIEASLKDILEAVHGLAKMLPQNVASAIDDIAESISD